MISEKELQELVDFRTEESSVLSLYLNVDPTQHTKDEYRLTLKSMLKGVANEASAKDLAEVEKYFDFQYDWQGKGVVIFSCLEEDFWRAYPLAVPVENHVFVADSPYIKPLTDVLDEYGRYGVILVDREGARFLLFHQGELEETDGTLGEEVKRTKRGGGSAAGRLGGLTARTSRHEEKIAQRNLKEAAELAVRFCGGGRCGRIVLGGTDETLTQFQGMLPKELQEQVVGSIPLDMAASETEVLNRSLEVIQEVDRRREEELVEQLITAATSKGGHGALGLDDTLAAVQEGRAHILVVAEGYTATGYGCQNCGYVAAHESKKCPFCGGDMAPIEDTVNTIVRKAIESGMEVEVVKGCVALEKAGSIGAILRY
jgi:peptide chain release factor subunit 1